MGNLHIDSEAVQRRFATLGVVPDGEWVSDVLVSRCRTEGDAVVLCWAKRTRKAMTLRQAAEELSIQPSHMSNILSGKKYLPHDFRINFQRLCGNWAIRQYEDRACGFLTSKETPEHRRIRELEAKLETYQRTD